MAKTNVTSEIAGVVWKIEKQSGDWVEAEEAILILELMKMEIPILAPISGTLEGVTVDEGAMVDVDQVVAVIDG